MLATAGVGIENDLQCNDRNTEQGFVKLADCDPSASTKVNKVTWTCEGAAHMVRENSDVSDPHGHQAKADDHHSEWWLRSREQDHACCYGHDDDRQERYCSNLGIVSCMRTVEREEGELTK